MNSVSDNRYQSIFNHSSEAILLCTENGHILSANPEASRLFGFTEEEFSRKNVRNLANLYDPGLEQVLETLFHTGKFIGELSFRRHDESLFTGLATANCFHPESGERQLSILIRDMTPMKEQASQMNMLIKAIHSSGDIIFHTDLNGVFRFVNKTFCNTYGYTEEEVIGKATPRILKSGKMDQKFYSGFWEQLLQGNEVKIELINKTKSGTLITVEVSVNAVLNESGQVCSFIGIQRDITTRKAVEEALERSENNLKAIFDNTNMGFVLMDKHYLILSANAKADEMSLKAFGHKNRIGQSFLETVPVHRKEQFKGLLNRVTNGKHTQYEVVHHLEDGSNFWVDVTANPIRNREGEITNISIGLRDISKKKKAELENEKLFLAVNNKNNELMQFNYIVSHNLRSPVANLLGLTNLIRMPSIRGKDKDQVIEHIHKAAMHMDSMLKDLNLILSTRSNINTQKEQVNLHALLEGITDALEKEIQESNCLIRTELGKEAADLFTVKSYLESSLYNLINNAIKYRHPDRRLEIRVNAIREKEELILTVQDNGSGIDLVKYGSYMFGLYKRFHPSVEGKGLGLHMTRTQIESLGGTITVASVSGEGSTFTIRLPV